MFDETIVIGAGGHGKVVADALLKYGEKVPGFLDDNPEAHPCNFKLFGAVSDIVKYKNTYKFIIGIGNNTVRKQIAQTYDVFWHMIIHPSATIGRKVKLKAGTVVLANAVINTYSQIGHHCIINTGAIVEHDNVIGDYTHISPGVALGGGVTIGSNVHIGIGATVKNGINITDNCIIGAGAVVVKDIVEPGTYVGVPAKRIKQM